MKSSARLMLFWMVVWITVLVGLGSWMQPWDDQPAQIAFQARK
jgi:hypothetical protein